MNAKEYDDLGLNRLRIFCSPPLRGVLAFYAQDFVRRVHGVVGKIRWVSGGIVLCSALIRNSL